MSYLVELLPEVLLDVLSYCSVIDLSNLSCCNSYFYMLCKEILWTTIRIPWNCLTREDCEQLIKERELLNFSSTKVLRLQRCRFSKEVVRGRSLLKVIWDNYDKIIEHLNCRMIHTLSITDMHIRGSSLKRTCKLFSELTNFTIIRGKGIPKTLFADIAKLKYLTKLNLVQMDQNSGYISDNNFSVICTGLARLQCLDISYCSICEKGLAHLKRLNCLRELDISGTEVTDTGFWHVGTLVSLKKLGAKDNNRILDVSLSYLHNLTLLEEIYLSRCNCLTDVGITVLSKLLKLKTIDISEISNITDEGVTAIFDLPSLVDLNIAYTNVTHLGILFIASSSSLRKLFLKGTKYTDETILHLQSFTSLKTDKS